MLNYLQKNENKNNKRDHNDYLNYLTIEGRRRRSGYIPRISLVNPISSPFIVIMRYADDGALIKATCLNFSAFRSLLELFTPLAHDMTLYSAKGVLRKKKIESVGPDASTQPC